MGQMRLLINKTKVNSMSTKPTSNTKKILSVVGLLLAGGAFGYGIGALLKGTIDKQQWGLDVSGFTMISLLLLSVFLVLLIHELGHIVGGLIGGNTFALLIVGPLRVEKEEEKLRWRLNKSMSAFGGLALTMPNSTENFKQRRALTVAAGPGASLLLAVLAWGLVFLTDPTVLQGAFRFFLFCLGGLSLIIFVATIIPMQSGGFLSDGMQLVQIFSNNPSAKRYEALLQLMARIQQGLRPKEIGEEELAVTTSLGYDDTFGLSALHYKYYKAVDGHDLVQAAELIQLLEDRIHIYPSPFQNTLWVEVAIFYSLIVPDLEKARPLADRLESYLNKEKNKFSTHLLRLGMAQLMQDESAIQDYTAKVLQAKGKDGVTDMYKDWVQEKTTSLT